MKTNQKSMKALVHETKDVFPSWQDWPTPTPKKGETLIELSASALNHRDVWICKGQYANIVLPAVLGSDGCGIVENGKRVIIDPSLNWPKKSTAQPSDYQILGMPSQGTQAQFIVAAKTLVHSAPEHLSDAQAAALPLAGVTAWRALITKCQLQKGEKVLVTGIGGGVALMALQLALAAGAEVWVSSSKQEKIEKALALGAKNGVLYTDELWHKSINLPKSGFDVIIDGAGGAGFEKLLRVAAPSARIAVYGGTQGSINNLSPQLLFWKQISIFGSTMGSSQEFKELLKFVNQHQVTPIVDSIWSVHQANDAYTLMERGAQFGKIVIAVK
jgi:zinc-binding alcohol dehydrogenase/oxidoreductase